MNYRENVPINEYNHLLNRHNIFEKEFHRISEDRTRVIRELSLLKHNIRVMEWNNEIPKGTLDKLLQSSLDEKIKNMAI